MIFPREVTVDATTSNVSNVVHATTPTIRARDGEFGDRHNSELVP